MTPSRTPVPTPTLTPRTSIRVGVLAILLGAVIAAVPVPQARGSMCCPPDWDNSGGQPVVPDIFAFLGDWFAGYGDYNNDGATTVPDIFAFLTGWFAGCQMPCYWGEANPHDPDEWEPAVPGVRRPPPAVARAAGLGRAFESHVRPFSGEVVYSAVDMTIAGRGEGVDFVWARRYRSQLGGPSPMGNNWDHSYNIFVAAAGPNMVLRNGWGRADLYVAQPDGSWVCPGHMRVLTTDMAGAFTLTFPDRGVWRFNPLFGPGAGRIAIIADRNGNALTFQYDAADRLAVVMDTLGRPITLSYDGPGPGARVVAVADFSGRSVVYAYYTAAGADGLPGDLRSARSPIVVGTPTGNDFPAGKTTTYTYTTGMADARLNHNLRTIIDPRGNTRRTFSYTATTNTADPMFDRCTRVEITTGDARECVQIAVMFLRPGPANNFAACRAFTTDGLGHLVEFFYDRFNRVIVRDAYTGLAAACVPTTETANRPGPALRPTDPARFRTVWTHNAHGLVTRVEHPRGNSDNYAYDSGNASARLRSRVLSHTMLPGTIPSDQAQIVQTMQYLAGFGPGFVTSHTGARGFVTTHAYDAQGNRVQTVHPVAGVVHAWAYNAFGQMVRHDWPDNGSGHVRRDVHAYHPPGPQHGYLASVAVDSPGLMLTTTYQYDARGNRIRATDPLGQETRYEYNALDQVVRVRSPELATLPAHRINLDIAYDANDNVTMVGIENRDENGLAQVPPVWAVAYTYDDRNLRIASARAIQPGTDAITRYEYDANDNLALERSPLSVSGDQPADTIAYSYDERDLPWRRVRAPLSPDRHTDTFDYDPNGNLAQARYGVEVVPWLWMYAYDGYDRRIQAHDPMGNVTLHRYDAAGNPGGNASEAPAIPNPFAVRVMGELNDVPGAAGNIRLSELQYAYDAMDRRIRIDVLRFDPATQAPFVPAIASYAAAYTPCSQIASITDPLLRTYTWQYDAALRTRRHADARGNTTVYQYDGASRLISTTESDLSDGGAPTQMYATTFGYDAMDRRILTTDNAGGLTRWGYDSRGNVVRTTDALARQRLSVYDGLSRLVRTVHDMNGNGPSAGDPPDIVASFAYDLNNRPVSRTDDNNHATRHAYDALGRLIVTQMADGTIEQYGAGATWALAAPAPNLAGFIPGYELHDVLVTRTDANGTRINNTIDLLGRTTSRSILPGPGVVGTTVETYQYDGLSRLVRAQDNDSLVTRVLDSRGHLLRETTNLGAPGFGPGTDRTVSITRDVIGNATQIAYPGGRTLGYDYDVLNRPIALRDTALIQPLALRRYVGASRVERVDFMNSTRLELFHDSLRRETLRRLTLQPVGTPLDDRACIWDPVHNKLGALNPSPAGPNDRNYIYDAADRLVRSMRQIAGPPPPPIPTDYQLDGLGNRIAAGAPPMPYIMSPVLPNPADLQVNQYTQTPFDTRQYNNNGCLVMAASANNRSFTYDYRNQVVSYASTSPAAAAQYKYDGLGRRVEKTVGGVITRFYSLGDTCVEEQNSANATTATYFGWVGDIPSVGDWDGDGRADMICGMTRSSQTFFYHPDETGSIYKVTDQTGNVIEKYEYADYGAVSYFSGAGAQLTGSAIGNPMGFRGERHDPESSLVVFGIGCIDRDRDGLGDGHDVAAAASRYLDPLSGRAVAPAAANSVALDCMFSRTDMLGSNPTASGNPTQERRSSGVPYREPDPNGCNCVSLFCSSCNPSARTWYILSREVLDWRYIVLPTQACRHAGDESPGSRPSYGDLSFQTDGPIIRQALFQRLARRAPADWLRTGEEIFVDTYGAAPGGGGGAGGGSGFAVEAWALEGPFTYSRVRAEFYVEDFRFTRKIEKASPDLWLHCCTGEHYDRALLTCRKPELVDLLVSSYQTGGSRYGDVVPTECVTLNFASIKFNYAEQKDKRSGGGGGGGRWGPRPSPR